MQVADLRSLGIFDGLTDAQLAELIAGGTEVADRAGRRRSSARAIMPTSGGCWWTGRSISIRHVGREDTVVARMDVPGRWAGGFRAWDEHGVYLATGRGVIGPAGCSGCRPRCSATDPMPGSRSAVT